MYAVNFEIQARRGGKKDRRLGVDKNQCVCEDKRVLGTGILLSVFAKLWKFQTRVIFIRAGTCVSGRCERRDFLKE